MSRLCWIFVLLTAAVVFVSSDARPHGCEQRERSLADLDLAEDALKRAKLLVPNCEEENEIPSECSKKDKSLGLIDVALDLVSNAKKNIPICPQVPTDKPLTTEEPSPEVTTEEPTPKVTTEEPTPEVSTEEPLTEVSTEEPLTEVSTEEPSSEVSTEESSSEVSTEEPTPKVTTEEPTPEVKTEKPTPEVTTEDRRPIDCLELQDAGVTTSGVYTVWLRGKPVPVRCDMDTFGGGWTVIQRRGKFSKQENFDRNWEDYKNGFGNLEEEFWLGNDNIFSLSNQGNYSLLMNMKAADGESSYAFFREFRIGGENTNYKLRVGGGYSGSAGDSMDYSNNFMFSTRDRKNEKNPYRDCTEERKGGFWYFDCARCNPNGLYQPGVNDFSTMHYWTFKRRVGLVSMDMKLKRML